MLVDAVVGRHVCTYTLDWFHKSQGLVNIEGYDPFRVSICSVLVRACAQQWCMHGGAGQRGLRGVVQLAVGPHPFPLLCLAWCVHSGHHYTCECCSPTRSVALHMAVQAVHVASIADNHCSTSRVARSRLQLLHSHAELACAVQQARFRRIEVRSSRRALERSLQRC